MALALKLQVALKVALPEAASVAAALMLPLPLAGQEPPLDALQVQVHPLNAAGNVSATVTPLTGSAMGLLATMV